MKKKSIFALLTALLCLLCVFVFVACDDGDDVLEEADGHTHSLTHHAAIAATCVDEGTVEYWRCESCGLTFSDENGTKEIFEISVGKSSHTLVYQNRLEPTCTAGYVAHYACSVCRATFADDGGKAPISAQELVLSAVTVHAYDGIKCATCGLQAPYTREGNTITFGSYPQTLVQDDATISKLNAVSNVSQAVQDPSWISFEDIRQTLKYRDIPFENQRYRGIVYCRENDENQFFWFLWEPLQWTVLEQSTDGVVTVRCNVSMDSSVFQDQYTVEKDSNENEFYYTNANGAPDGTLANSYQYSAVRKWLNESFYHTAFNELQQQLVQTVTLDGNQAMKDKVYLLSYEEALAEDWCLDAENGRFKPSNVLCTQYNNVLSNCRTELNSLLPRMIERTAFETKILAPLAENAPSRDYQKFQAYYVQLPYKTYLEEGRTEHAEAIADVYPITKEKNIDIYVLSRNIGVKEIRKLEQYVLEYCPDYTFEEMMRDHEYTEYGLSLSEVHGERFADWIFRTLTEDTLQSGGMHISVLEMPMVSYSGIDQYYAVIPQLKIKLYHTAGLSYVLNDEGTAYTVTNGHVVTESDIGIPSYYQGKPVTAIGDGAFGACRYLTSITIPSSVTSIGDYAFAGCDHLTFITIPASVTSIGSWVFEGCDGLTQVNFEENGRLSSIDDYAFAECGLTEITIPASVTSIGSWVFDGCDSLFQVNFEENSQLSVIDDYAFSGCGLTSITIPASVTSIGDSAFRWCDNLTAVYISDLAAWCNISFYNHEANPLSNGADLYLEGALVVALEIPNTVTSIKDCAFYNCTSITSVKIPASVTSIGDGAFMGCSGLTSINIPESVTSIGFNAFYDCDSLTSVTFETTSGWWVSTSFTATSGTALSATDLAKTGTAADYLTATYYYCNYYWQRS